MFEKWESFAYPNTDVKALHTSAFQWWHNAGFKVTEVGPGHFNAVSDSKWGLEREANVRVREEGRNSVVELRMKANVTTEGIVGGGLALILVFPVAVVGGAYSYSKYERDARDLMTAFWNTLASTAQFAPMDHKEEVVHTTAIDQEEMDAIIRPYEAVPALSEEDKLRMLEDRLARGEISEETYNSIKARMNG
jgi:hypothetical protein